MRTISKIAHRLYNLGVHGTTLALKTRVRKRLFALQWKTKAHALCANHTSAPTPHDIVAAIRHNPNFLARVPNTNSVTRANDACNNCFDLLGSGKQCFKTIPWHTDFKTNEPPFPLAFYQDIQPSKSTGSYAPDIKVPWELSRFQRVYHLGVAYEQTKDQKYADTFARHITDWIEKNPFLLGVNWVCPMDVALRAINLIWGYSFFKNTFVSLDTIFSPKRLENHSRRTETSQSFWQELCNSLHDHLVYLESNWETSDKPNNHYISDLVGYLYLTSFFQLKKKQAWCVKKLLEQMDQQVQPDGTSYEGSTAYHKLVTELFWHVQLVCAEQNISLLESFHAKLKNMFTFFDAVSMNEHEFVQIGDNDSGKVVTGIRPAQEEREQTAQTRSITHSVLHSGRTVSTKNQGERTKINPFVLSGAQRSRTYLNGLNHFPNFGLTVIKKDGWHITYRHPTFAHTQPSGHFHRDELSVTLAIDNIPILIDPGSYLYTANPIARNRFRGTSYHNTFAPVQQNTFLCDLFQLDRRAQPDTANLSQSANFISIENKHQQRKRTLMLDTNKQTIIINDQHTHQNAQTLRWNFLFHPAITVIQNQDNTWNIVHNEKTIAQLHTSLNLTLGTKWYSPEYGIKESCAVLMVQHTLNPNSPIVTQITKILN